MKKTTLLLLFFWMFQGTIWSQVGVDMPAIDKIADSLERNKNDFLYYKLHKGYETTPYEIVFLIENGDEIMLSYFIKNEKKSYTKHEKWLKAINTVTEIRRFTQEIGYLTLCKCMHYSDELSKADKGTRPICITPYLKHDIGRSYNEWQLVYVYKEGANPVFHTAFQCKLFTTRCMDLYDNLRARAKFKRFKRFVDSNK